MTNKQLLEKLKEDMELRGFSHWTKDNYYRKAKEITEYFGKPMRQVTTKELREFLMNYIVKCRQNIFLMRFMILLPENQLSSILSKFNF